MHFFECLLFLCVPDNWKFIRKPTNFEISIFHNYNKKEVYFIEHVLKNSMNEYGYELNKNTITQNEIEKAMVFLKKLPRL